MVRPRRRLRYFLFGQPRPVIKDCTVLNDLDRALPFTSDDHTMKVEHCKVTHLRGLGFQLREDRHMNLLRRLWHRLTRRRPTQVQVVSGGGFGIQARGDVYIDGKTMTNKESS